jgi:integral membrane sensor domain MASE1
VVDGNRKRYVARIALVAGAYYGAAKLGLELAFHVPSVTAVWPPTGIALAALILWGRGMWPGVALGAFLANAWTGVPIHTVLGITTGNTLEAVVGAFLLVRVAGFRPSLERVSDVVALAVLGGIVSTIVSATIGVTSLLVGDEIAASEYGSVWRTWWLGDMGGDLIVAPALLVAATHWPFRRAPGRPFEAIALVLILGGFVAIEFSQTTAALYPYQAFPFLIWAALRFWQPGAVIASLLVAGIAIPLTEADLGPFAGNSPDERLLLAQAFVSVASLTSLILAAVITERQRVEETLASIADTLQEGLRPSRLPQVPGLETAVAFEPAGERYLVGGDFYDLFEADDGAWAVVVGDVRGKGARAAATTALARYTLRDAAVQERRPSRILERLNDAIMRQSPDQSCTVAYARFELDGGAGARMTLAIGGHPLPLLLRGDGTVEAVGRPGTLLGVLPDPKVADQVADLGPGDALLLYTDGLTDAYAPRRIVTPAQLSATLGSCAGRSADEIVAGIREAILDPVSGEPRDDIIVFAIRVPDSDQRVEGARRR